MKWVYLKGDRIVGSAFAPDKATAERYVPVTFGKGVQVMSTSSYEVWREEQAVIRRDHKPPNLWEKSR